MDLFILETFSNIEMLLAAIDAIRSFSGAAHRRAADVFRRRHDARRHARRRTRRRGWRAKNVQAIGANCTLGPQSLLPVLEGLAAAGRPHFGDAQRGLSASASGTAPSTRALRRNISRSLRGRRRPWARASWAAAAAPRPSIFARLPTAVRGLPRPRSAAR